ncbi:peptidoglycan-binding protein [Candidatus Kaiserbacteria bacterium]|nr:peptidoglycan-binding protein [Candidatus Kaiserbacteria bacterium]
MAVSTKFLFTLAAFVIPLSFAHADASVSFSPSVVHPSTATWALTESGYNFDRYIMAVFDSTGHEVQGATNNSGSNSAQSGTFGCWVEASACGASFYSFPDKPAPFGTMTVVVFDTTVDGYSDGWCNQSNSTLSGCEKTPAFVTETTFDFEPDPPGVLPIFVLASNSDGSLSATVPSATDATTTASGVDITISVPSNTTITGPAGWDGVVNLPQVAVTFTAPSDPNSTDTVISAIEIGAADTPLTFDKAARLLFAGQAGQLVGWSRGGVFTPIIATCADDTQATNDGLAPGSDCKRDSGTDLAVWTKHFTTFITYTKTAMVSSGSVGGGGGSTPPPFSAPSAPAPAASATGQVLGVAAYNFSKNLYYGTHDSDVAELQKFLVAKGYSIPDAVTEYFGPETLAAVKAFQSASGIKPTGFAGVITRGVLNQGTTSR